MVVNSKREEFLHCRRTWPCISTLLPKSSTKSSVLKKNLNKRRLMPSREARPSWSATFVEMMNKWPLANLFESWPRPAGATPTRSRSSLASSALKPTLGVSLSLSWATKWTNSWSSVWKRSSGRTSRCAMRMRAYSERARDRWRKRLCLGCKRNLKGVAHKRCRRRRMRLLRMRWEELRRHLRMLEHSQVHLHRS